MAPPRGRGGPGGARESRSKTGRTKTEVVLKIQNDITSISVLHNKNTDTAHARYAARFGFPGKTNRSWGWLGGNIEDDPFPWEDDEEEDGEEGEDELVQRAMAGEDGRPTVPTGEVVGVKNREDLQALTGEGGTILFVSSKSCRACKYLTP